MLVRHCVLRLLRLLVTLAALFAAHPSLAAPAVIDRIVLVSGTGVLEAPADGVDAPPEREDESPHAAVSLTALSDGGRAAVAPTLAPLQSTRALRDRAYLLHCALLR